MTAFVGRAVTIPESVREHMRGRSWQAVADCPAFDELRLLEVDYWGFDDASHRGEMVVAAEVADELVAVFECIWAARFPIGEMRRIDWYDADDPASMAANNASSFCFRTAPSGRLSEHAFGLAVDINPVQNPMVIGDRVWPEAGRGYLDREDPRPGMITAGGVVVRAFADAGWEWGGDWMSLKDWHHFQKRPRPTR